MRKYLLNYFWLFITIFVFSYLIYRSEFIWNGERRLYYLNYIIISLILIFFSIIFFFLSYKIRQYINIILISSIFSIYLFECYLFVNKNYLEKSSIKIKTNILTKKIIKNYDNRSKLEVYEDLKKDNNNLSLTVGPQQFSFKDKKYFLLSGVSKSKTINCNENGYYSIYQSDRYGFNNPDLEWEDNTNLVIIGDSFALGACVNNEDSIAFLLRKNSKKSLVNLGYPGLGPLTQYVSLREYFPAKAKNIIWLFYEGNDLLDLRRELKNKILMNYLNDTNFSQNLKINQTLFNDLYKIKVQEEFDEIKNQKNIQKRYDPVKIVLDIVKLNNIRPIFFNDKLPLNRFVEIVKKVKIYSDRNKAELYFVYLPEYKRFKTSYDNTNYEFIKKKINELDINFIDIKKNVFEKEKNPLSLFPFEKNGHYNVNGYNKVYKEIYRMIKN